MNISFWNISAIYRDWLHSLGRYISKGCQHYWTCIQKASFSGSMKPLIILSFPPKLGREFENYQVCVQTLLTFLIHLLFTHGPYLTTILSQIWHVVENKGKRLLEDFLHISRIFGSCRSQYGQISPWCPGLRCKTNVPQNSPATGEKISVQKWAKKNQKKQGVESNGTFKGVFCCLIDSIL